MTDEDLLAQAAHYRRVADLVSDEEIVDGLRELAAEYEAAAGGRRGQTFDDDNQPS